jgi:hypothetical protein
MAQSPLLRIVEIASIVARNARLAIASGFSRT